MSDMHTLRARLQQVSTPDAADHMRALGISRCVMAGLRALVPMSSSIAGQARTLRLLPDREDLKNPPNSSVNRGLYDSIRDGEILVLDAMGVAHRAAIGDMMYSRIQTGGAIGVVVDGAVRDVPFATEHNFPLFARGSAVDSFFSWLRPWEADKPIQCGGVLVVPGDWLIADNEGIVVVPAPYAEALAQKAEAKRELDAFSQALLFDGFGLDDAYPLPAHMKPFLQEFSRTGKLPSRDDVAAVRPKPEIK